MEKKRERIKIESKPILDTTWPKDKHFKVYIDGIEDGGWK